VRSLLLSRPGSLRRDLVRRDQDDREQLARKGFDFKQFYGTDGNYGVISKKDTNVDIAGAQFTNPGVEATKKFQADLQALVNKAGWPLSLNVFSYAAESYDAGVLAKFRRAPGWRN
jgi:branched-chain amino acid transport system substrate-binding protein